MKGQMKNNEFLKMPSLDFKKDLFTSKNNLPTFDSSKFLAIYAGSKSIALKGYSARHLTAKLRTEIGMSAASS